MIQLTSRGRRYAPVTYKGKPVLVPYTFLVSFNPPPDELARISAVRIEVFRALLLRLRGPAVDAGAEARPLVCAGIGDDIADPPRNEMDALARAGAQVEPASSCWGLMQTVGGAAPFRVHLSTAVGGGVEARMAVDPSRESSLAREAVELLAAARETAIAIRAARRADDAGESVLDILA